LKNTRHRTYTVAGIILAAGAALVVLGLVRGATPETLTGVVLCISAQMLACMRIIYRWVSSTSAERAALLASKQHHDTEAAKHAAGLIALAAERDRVHQESIAGARRRDQMIEADRAKLEIEFQERRAALISQAVETGVKLARSGALDAEADRARVIVPFPAQPADYERARGRGRDVIP